MQLSTPGAILPDTRRPPFSAAGLSFDDQANAGRWVEEQARELGISVSRIAKEARVDRCTIHRWKRGDTEPYWSSFRRVRGVIEGYWSERRDRLLEGA